MEKDVQNVNKSKPPVHICIAGKWATWVKQESEFHKEVKLWGLIIIPNNPNSYESTEDLTKEQMDG